MAKTEERPLASNPPRRYPNPKIADPAKLRLGDCCWPVGGGVRPPNFNIDGVQKPHGPQTKSPRG